MRKKKKKQVMEGLAVAAFVLQAVEIGIRLWEIRQNFKQSAGANEA